MFLHPKITVFSNKIRLSPGARESSVARTTLNPTTSKVQNILRFCKMNNAPQIQRKHLFILDYSIGQLGAFFLNVYLKALFVQLRHLIKICPEKVVFARLGIHLLTEQNKIKRIVCPRVVTIITRGVTIKNWGVTIKNRDITIKNRGVTIKNRGVTIKNWGVTIKNRGVTINN